MIRIVKISNKYNNNSIITIMHNSNNKYSNNSNHKYSNDTMNDNT